MNRFFYILSLCAGITLWSSSTHSAQAQLPAGLPVAPENFASTHFFGSPGAVNIDHLSMGSAGLADDTADWHSNPAGVLAVRQPTFLTYHQSAGFDALPAYRSTFFGYAQPLDKDFKTAFKLSYIPVRSSGSVVGTPLRVAAEENDTGLEIAHRITDRLWLGLGLSYLSTKSDYSIAGLGRVTHLESRPSGLGGRIGFIYKANKYLSFGGTIDRYSEDVKQSVPLLGSPATSFKFDSKAYGIGACIKTDRNQKILIDYQSGQLTGNGVRIVQRPLLIGGEQKLGDFALRVGSYDGKLTGGFGFQKGKIQIAYGFTNRYSKNIPGKGANTAHAIQLTFGF